MSGVFLKRDLRALWFFIFLLGFLPLCFCETLTLKNGRTIEGRIRERTDRYIKIEVSGVSLTYHLEDIASLDGEPLSLEPTTKQQTGLAVKSSETLHSKTSPAVVAIMDKRKDREITLGAGFIVNGKGIIISSYHTLLDTHNPFVRLKDSQSYPVEKVLYKDALRDLIILKIEPQKDLASLTLGNSDYITIGRVYSFAPPLDGGFSLTKGFLSDIRTHQNLKYLQFSPVLPAASGSPLLNYLGEVIGLVVKAPFPSEKDSFFALAINEIKPYLGSFSPTLKDILRRPIILKEKDVIDQQDFIQVPDKVIDYYQKLLKYDSSDAYAYYNLGLAYYYKNNFVQAIFNYNRALQINPNYAEAYFGRAMVHFRKDSLQEALSDIDRALKLNPNLGQAYSLRSLISQREKKLQEALTDISKAIQLDSKNSAYYTQRANIYYEKDDFAQALLDYSKAIELEPYNTEALFNRGLIYFKKDQLDLAWSDFNKVIQLDPDNIEAYLQRGIIQHKRGDFDQALLDYNRFLEAKPDLAVVYYYRGNIYYQQGYLEKALGDYNKALELDPHLSEVYFNRAVIYFLENKYQQAYRDIEEARRLGYVVPQGFILELEKALGKKKD